MYGITFLKQFMAGPKRVGALVASSRWLAEAITEAAGVCEASAVLELGPGTGAVTEVIIRKLGRGAPFLAIEISPEFVEVIRKRCPGVRVVQDSAENAKKRLAEMGAATCDCIVSGLPWASFDDDLQDKLLATVLDVLAPGGRFAAYTYIHSPLLPGGRRFRDKLCGAFREVEKTPVVWANLPPAFVYYAKK